MGMAPWMTIFLYEQVVFHFHEDSISTELVQEAGS